MRLFLVYLFFLSQILTATHAQDSCFDKLEKATVPNKKVQSPKIENEQLIQVANELISRGAKALTKTGINKAEIDFLDLTNSIIGRELKYENFRVMVSQRFGGMKALEELLNLKRAELIKNSDQDFEDLAKELLKYNLEKISKDELERNSIDFRTLSKNYLKKETSFESFRVMVSQRFGSMKELELKIGHDRDKASIKKISLKSSPIVKKIHKKWSKTKLINFIKILVEKGVDVHTQSNLTPYLDFFKTTSDEKVSLSSFRAMVVYHFGGYDELLKRSGARRLTTKERNFKLKMALEAHLLLKHNIKQNREFAFSKVRFHFPKLNTTAGVLSKIKEVLSPKDYQNFKFRHFYKDLAPLLKSKMLEKYGAKSLEDIFVRHSGEENFNILHQVTCEIFGFNVKRTKIFAFIKEMDLGEEHFEIPEHIQRFFNYIDNMKLFIELNSREIVFGKTYNGDDDSTYELLETNSPEDILIQSENEYLMELFLDSIEIDEESLALILDAIMEQGASTPKEVYAIYPDLEYMVDVEAFFELAKEIL